MTRNQKILALWRRYFYEVRERKARPGAGPQRGSMIWIARRFGMSKNAVAGVIYRAKNRKKRALQLVKYEPYRPRINY